MRQLIHAVIHLSGCAMLFWVDWRILVGAILLIWAHNMAFHWGER